MKKRKGGWLKAIAVVVGIGLFIASPGLAIVLAIACFILVRIVARFTKRKAKSNGPSRKSAKTSAAEQHKLYLPDDYVALDTETTGLSSATDRIIEIGAVRIRNRQITDRFSALINPGLSLGPHITDLTGITDEMLDGQPAISTVLPDFYDWLGNDPVVGHNIKFDLGFFAAESERIKLNAPKPVYYDTLHLSRTQFPEERHHRLVDLIQRFGIAEVEEHRALSDAIQTYQCFEWLRTYIESNALRPKKSRKRRPRKSEDSYQRRARADYINSHDCEPRNYQPEGRLIADVRDCGGVDVSRRGDYQELFARYGKGTWLWVVVTRGYTPNGKDAGLPTIEVWADGEYAGFLTQLQASRYFLHVPEEGGVTQAHIRQDNKSGRYRMRVELPPAHEEIDLLSYMVEQS